MSCRREISRRLHGSVFASGLIDRGDEAALSEALSLSQLAIASVTETSASAGLAHTNLARIHSRSGHPRSAEQHAQQGERVLRASSRPSIPWPVQRWHVCNFSAGLWRRRNRL